MIDAASFGQEARQESSQGLASNYMGGVEPARGLLRGDNFSESLGGAPNPMRDAIRSKYNQGFEQSNQRLGLEMKKAGQADHLRKLEVATQLASEEHAQNVQKEMLRKKRAQQDQAMRAQIVGQVLGIAGGIAGGALTMNPGGAMAGYMAGQGVGQAVGGGMG